MLIIKHESENGSHESPLNLPPYLLTIKRQKQMLLLVLQSKLTSHRIHAFFISKTFISNFRLKLSKNQANAKH